MKNVLLFIRDHGSEDVIAFYLNESAARQALISYVRQQHAKAHHSESTDDDIAIETYFARKKALFVIARVRPVAPTPTS